MDEPEPIDQSALHLDSLTSRAAGMSRRKQSNPRQIKRKFPSCCLAVAARLAGALSPNIAAISDQNGAETAQAQLPPLMCCLSRSTDAPVAPRNYFAVCVCACVFFLNSIKKSRISIRTLQRCSAEKFPSCVGTQCFCCLLEVFWSGTVQNHGFSHPGHFQQ